ncbi:MAG: undecaprenyl/decaprenyl-phosphate alpha-N-acetylglucosaminyl 1-phosphate transferase [Herpetosiphon sp.]|nr:undecaprenyl/decaprenyl-phosphate alpha-N-acetylglucosaminyl 1-phosphate transferase [Herpetosiphon sp.]
MFIRFAIVFGIGFLTTVILTPLVRAWCIKRGLYDLPEARRVHVTPTPRLGGIAIFAGFMLALGAAVIVPWNVPQMDRYPIETFRLGLLALGTTLMWVVMTIDDLKKLSARFRLIIQILAALIAVGPYLWEQTLHAAIPVENSGARGIIATAINTPFGQINFHDIYPPLAIGFTVFWLVGMTNALNWIDGLDGLAAGVTLIAALVLAMHTFSLKQYSLVLLPLALAGACAGFLPHNFHPAKIFMGDGGAMVLGYVLAICSIIGGAKLATALLVLGVPLLDGVWMIISRSLRSGKAMNADRAHLHHRLHDMGLSQRQVVAFYYGVSALFGALGVLLPDRGLKLIALIVLTVLLAGLLVWLARKPVIKPKSAK